MVTPSRPIYYLNLFDRLCQPCDSLKRVSLLRHDETVCWEMSTNNMKKRLEWKKCADSGTSEKSGSHGLYWGTRVPLTPFNSFSHTSLCSVLFNSCPRRLWCFFVHIMIKSSQFSFLSNLIKRISMFKWSWVLDKDWKSVQKKYVHFPTFVLICVISMCTGVLQRWVLLQCNVWRCGLWCVFLILFSKLKFCNNLGRPRPCGFVY